MSRVSKDMARRRTQGQQPTLSARVTLFMLCFVFALALSVKTVQLFLTYPLTFFIVLGVALWIPVVAWLIHREHQKKELFAQRKERVAFMRQRNPALRTPYDSRYIPQEIRVQVMERCHGMCVECGTSFHLEYDHVIPLSRGGATSANNLQILCRACNIKKYNHI